MSGARTLKILLLGLAVVVAAVVLAACGGRSAVSGRDRDNTRFATQDEINTENIGELGEAWSTGLGPNQYLMESFPLVLGEDVYVTTSTDEVMAINGKDRK